MSGGSDIAHKCKSVKVWMEIFVLMDTRWEWRPHLLKEWLSRVPLLFSPIALVIQ